jgi:hypothetical protein
MRRGGGAVKRSPTKPGKPLTRGSKPLKRSAKPITRRKRITPRSKKRAKVYRDIRVPFVVRVLRERPRCEAGPMFAAGRMVGFLVADVRTASFCLGTADTVHELLPRKRGGRIDDLADDEVVSCCHRCHLAIHQVVPLTAAILGLLNDSADGPRPQPHLIEWRAARGIVLAGRRNDSTERSEGEAHHEDV